MNQSISRVFAPSLRPLSPASTRPGAPTGGLPRGGAMHTQLDAIDWKILAELQRDGRITNVELSRRVGISAPPCLRRMRALEEAGIIRGYRALLDEKRLGYDITVFAMVHLVEPGGSGSRRLRGTGARLAAGARMLDAFGRSRLHSEMRRAGFDYVSGIRFRTHIHFECAQREDGADAAALEGRGERAAGYCRSLIETPCNYNSIWNSPPTNSRRKSSSGS